MPAPNGQDCIKVTVFDSEGVVLAMFESNWDEIFQRYVNDEGTHSTEYIGGNWKHTDSEDLDNIDTYTGPTTAADPNGTYPADPGNVNAGGSVVVEPCGDSSVSGSGSDRSGSESENPKSFSSVSSRSDRSNSSGGSSRSDSTQSDSAQSNSDEDNSDSGGPQGGSDSNSSASSR